MSNMTVTGATYHVRHVLHVFVLSVVQVLGLSVVVASTLEGPLAHTA